MKLMLWSLLLLALGLYAQTLEAATIYKCRQAGGVLSYQDQPCPGRQVGVIHTATVATPARAPAAPKAEAALPARKRVR